MIMRSARLMGEPFVADGDALRFAHSYDKTGNVSSAFRTVGTAASVTRAFCYDHLNRLTASTASTGEKNSYQYERAGHRVDDPFV